MFRKLTVCLSVCLFPLFTGCATVYSHNQLEEKIDVLQYKTDQIDLDIAKIQEHLEMDIFCLEQRGRNMETFLRDNPKMRAEGTILIGDGKSRHTVRYSHPSDKISIVTIFSDQDGVIYDMIWQWE